MNIINLTGRLTAEPDVVELKEKGYFIKFTLAVKKQRPCNNEDTNFFNVVSFVTNENEFIKKYINKGDLVGVTGNFEFERYINKNGDRVKDDKVYLYKIELLRKAGNPNDKK